MTRPRRHIEARERPHGAWHEIDNGGAGTVYIMAELDGEVAATTLTVTGP